MYGSGASHDDTQHFGSAKRDTNSGLAGLGSSGYLLAKGEAILLPRDGTNAIYIMERTSNEISTKIIRIGANDYDGYLRESAGLKQIQTESMKDVASGIASLDANSRLLVPGELVYITRDGTSNFGIQERTSAEPVLLFNRKAANQYRAYLNITGAYQLLSLMDINGDIPHMRPKAASANLRHGIAGQVSSTSVTYEKKRTVTFANGISGTLRIEFYLRVTVNDGTWAYGRIYKNGVALGTEQSTQSDVDVLMTEDINVGVLAPGDTLELWIHTSNAADAALAQLLKIYYDNAADTVLVAGVTLV
jgi:hypothetical protein